MKQGKLKSEAFRAARPHRLVISLARTLLPLALRRRGVRRVEIERADLERLKSLRSQRVILTPNHPTNNDPALIFELSKRSGMSFYYLCTREAFDAWRGVWGALIQRIGAYSIVRGSIDRESLRYTRVLLARRGTKLVIFPEGEVYSQNDSLLPFQTGAVQLAVWGREEARKKEPEAGVVLLPCAVRYRFMGDVRPALEGKIARLEAKLKLDRQGQDIYARLRQVSVAVLSAVEREYHLEPVEPGELADGELADGDLTPRFEAAKEAALARAAGLLGVKMPRGTLPEKMRALLHRAEQQLHEDDDEAVPVTLARQEDDRVRLAWNDLRRLANWIAIYDGYVSRAPSQEHVAEVVHRLETEVFGQASFAGPRIATVRVGEPLPLPEAVERKDLAELTLQLEKSVAALLHQAGAPETSRKKDDETGRQR